MRKGLEMSSAVVLGHYFDRVSVTCFKGGRAVLDYLDSHEPNELNSGFVAQMISSVVSSVVSSASGFRGGLEFCGCKITDCSFDELEYRLCELCYQHFMIGCGYYAQAIAKILLDSDFTKDSRVLADYSVRGKSDVFPVFVS